MCYVSFYLHHLHFLHMSPFRKTPFSISLSFFLSGSSTCYKKMSRNKDKYENSNPRRQQTFMSAEDVASGKKSNWQALEITGEMVLTGSDCRVFHCLICLFSFFFIGNVRNISPQLWQFDNLTSLYLNDNCLLRIPPDIGLLTSLRTLDISSNKLRSLPAELGELIQLR